MCDAKTCERNTEEHDESIWTLSASCGRFGSDTSRHAAHHQRESRYPLAFRQRTQKRHGDVRTRSCAVTRNANAFSLGATSAGARRWDAFALVSPRPRRPRSVSSTWRPEAEPRRSSVRDKAKPRARRAPLPLRGRRRVAGDGPRPRASGHFDRRARGVHNARRSALERPRTRPCAPTQQSHESRGNTLVAVVPDAGGASPFPRPPSPRSRMRDV